MKICIKSQMNIIKKKYNIVIKENNDNSLNKNIDYKIVNNPDKKLKL